MASNAQKFFSDGSSNTFHVHFDNPVQIEVSQSRDCLAKILQVVEVEIICTCVVQLVKAMVSFVVSA